MIRFSFRYFLLFFLLTSFFSVNCQTIDDLNKKRKSIEDNISKISSLIEETSKSKSLTVNNLKLIDQRIKLKNELIKQIESEIVFLNDKIIYSQHQIDSLEFLIGNVKEELAFILNTKFRNRDRVELIMFVLSSSSFNQAYVRVKFYKNLMRYQEKRLDDLKQLISIVHTNKLNLQNNYKLFKLKQVEKENELSKLVKDSKSYQQKVNEIKRKEKELRRDLLNEKKKSEAIAEQIKKIIEDEARRKKSNDTKTNEINYSLSKQFKENLGKLPSPVKDGVITATYGESNHPFLKGVKIKSNGIDITVSKNSNVYCIFDGSVTRIFSVPMSGVAVIVRHGSYLSVYSNLDKLEVKVGDKIKIGQKIGEVLKMSEKVGVLHLEVWNERSSENPANWISSFKGK